MGINKINFNSKILFKNTLKLVIAQSKLKEVKIMILNMINKMIILIMILNLIMIIIIIRIKIRKILNIIKQGKKKK